jgi:hypothetical protein
MRLLLTFSYLVGYFGLRTVIWTHQYPSIQDPTNTFAQKDNEFNIQFSIYIQALLAERNPLTPKWVTPAPLTKREA